LAPQLSELAPKPLGEIPQRPRLEAEKGQPNLEWNEREAIKQRVIEVPEDRLSPPEHRHSVRLEFASAITGRRPKRQPTTIKSGPTPILHRQIEDMCANLKRASLSRGRVEFERSRRRSNPVQVPPRRERFRREPRLMDEEIDFGLGEETLELLGARQAIAFAEREREHLSI
jgi:hypothetical protein